MRTLSNCEAALLVLLSEGAAHPYQIEKLVADRSMDYWSDLSQSSIYKTLRKLESKGYATSEVSLNEKNVGRKTYALTPSGQALLKETLAEYISVPERERWRIDLATSHLDLLSGEKVQGCLANYEVEVVKLIKGYEDLEVYLKESGCSEHELALARRPLRRYEAELAWVREYRTSILASGFKKGGEHGK